MATETPPDRFDIEMAAAKLAAVYLVLCEQKTKLSSDIIPPLPKEIRPGALKATLTPAISRIYTDEPPNVDLRLFHARQYAENYHAIMALLKPAVAKASVDVLDQQFRKLVELDAALMTEGVPELMNRVAIGARGRAGGRFDVDLRDTPGALASEEAELRYWVAKFAENRARVEAALTAQLNDWVPDRLRPLLPTVTKLFKTFACHPRFLDVLKEFADSPSLGREFARSLVKEALKATSDFSEELKQEPHHAWRYPAFTLAAVYEIGLMDIYGFPEFAVDLGAVYGSSPGETALMAAGVVIAFVGVFLASATVPGVAVNVALTVVGVADLGVNGMQTAVNYLQAREQDAAAIGSTLTGTRLAQRSDEISLMLSAAAALLSAIALVFTGAKLVASLRARQPWTLPPPPKTPPKAGRVRWDETATQGASGIGPGSRGKVRDVPSPSFREGAYRVRRDIGTTGVPDRARPMAVGATEEPTELVSAISKPTFEKAAGETEASVIPIASASKKGGGTKPPPAPPKSPSVVQTGTTRTSTPKGTATSKGPKLGAKGKAKPAAAAATYSPRKVAESLILKSDGEIWTYRADYRGHYIQSRLAKTDYKNYIEPLLRNQDELDQFFPVVDFVSVDGKHAVSLKTYDPYAKSALDLSIEDLAIHADELADFRRYSTFERVTLEVRVPPGTPPAAMNNIRTAISEFLRKGSGVDLVVKPWP
jgi:hypothetical protein